MSHRRFTYSNIAFENYRLSWRKCEDNCDKKSTSTV